MEPFSVALAPERLWQAINPLTWTQNGGQIGLVNIALGQTARPDIERTVLNDVGSYGRQIGRIGDALEVLIRHFDSKALDAAERDALTILMGQLAEIRKVKARARDAD
ncbi:hypothetical protein [Sphingobium sp. WCS2017Hpa-17]|uniref:hypothetical protein n=1 Tax=Sphingobium sp. WCS2017Hpa-17 TaxID=3073638 RepID=UPI0028892928|nr:hypothetical protein [Sphingobium sp. WCS2017Hpa-17]